jgi:hypothetical protein
MSDESKIQKLYAYTSIEDIQIGDCLNIEYKRCMDHWYPDIEYKYYPLKDGYNTIKFVDEKSVSKEELEEKVLEATKIIISGGKLEVEKNARAKRDQLLKETDWVSGEDVSQNIKDKWFPYRQALRDITSQEGWPMNIVWPEKPL